MRQLIAWLRGTALRDPFVIFLVVSGAIFLLYWSVVGRKQTIEVPVSVQRSLADDYSLMTGHAPDAEAKQKLIDDYVANELLFREAIARGMHMTDKATKQRLIDRVRFMIAGAPADPTEDQLIAWYASHQDLYRAEPEISLRHVFFEKQPADAPALLARLNGGGTVAGDDFWMGHDLSKYGISMLRGMFGQPFLDAIKDQPVGTWAGPIRSTRGWHFVEVLGRGDAKLLPYPVARDQVRQDYLAAETGAAVEKEVARLKQGYKIRVES
ncbi:peptidylprolyl isomerase [Novosphingobium album (ex Liu et al. 2023)]|uniref:Parvulin-like PPIase n=1 Tax=Novosphingobium album (ex Liu et al. 2023) TaxID=3031130 RepID=A0ABT5WUK9_9SPHN|nr:peptidylprolyl isomerase [Novosphingobium album (ex Liu et al. 2023)]MDE8653589.1 peptidylprolyl isomerase [Novosphingobium album (ex Liu et al. 2023)]